MVAAFDLVNYGFSSDEEKCPPQETYVLEFLKWDDPVEKEDTFNPGKMVSEMKFYWRIVGVPGDFSDEEREQWSGFEFRTFVNLVKDMNNEKAILPMILKALKPRDTPFGINERIPLQDYVGLKMKAFIKPSPSGWPKISNFAPATRRPSAAPRQAAPPPPAAAGDDGWE